MSKETFIFFDFVPEAWLRVNFIILFFAAMSDAWLEADGLKSAEERRLINNAYRETGVELLITANALLILVAFLFQLLADSQAEHSQRFYVQYPLLTGALLLLGIVFPFGFKRFVKQTEERVVEDV